MILDIDVSSMEHFAILDELPEELEIKNKIFVKDIKVRDIQPLNHVATHGHISSDLFSNKQK